MENFLLKRIDEEEAKLKTMSHIQTISPDYCLVKDKKKHILILKRELENYRECSK